MYRQQHGMTRTQFLQLLVLTSLIWAFLIALVRANVWYSESGILRQIQLEYPATSAVITSERHFFRQSKIYVEESGITVPYCIDTNILANSVVTRCDTDSFEALFPGK